MNKRRPIRVRSI